MIRTVIFSILTLLCSIQLSAQNNLSLQLMIPPGNEIHFDESLRAMITNQSEEPVEIYLEGFVQESEDGVIFEGQSSIFTVEQGVTNINRRNLEPLKPTQGDFSNSKYEDFATRASRFPPGDYQFCVRVVHAQDDQVVAEDCFEKSVEAYEPPSLISPEKGSLVNQNRPMFTWSPVPGSNTSIDYALEIVEIQGNQSPIAAFESNPLWYQQSDLGSPILQYPIAARSFDNQQQYAWKVSAFNNQTKIAESEVWSFIWKSQADTTAEKEEKEEEESETLIPEQYLSLKTEFDHGYYLIDDYELRFVYENQYAASQLQCNLETTENKIVARDILQKEQQSGMNFNQVSIANRVQPDKTYLLECTEQTGGEKGLRFRVRKEKSENVIEDIDLDESLFELQ